MAFSVLGSARLRSTALSFGFAIGCALSAYALYLYVGTYDEPDPYGSTGVVIFVTWLLGALALFGTAVKLESVYPLIAEFLSTRRWLRRTWQVLGFGGAVLVAGLAVTPLVSHLLPFTEKDRRSQDADRVARQATETARLAEEKSEQDWFEKNGQHLCSMLECSNPAVCGVQKIRNGRAAGGGYFCEEHKTSCKR